MFSQWAKCEIEYAPLKTTLNCAEQGMMLAKAALFTDVDAYNAIKNSKDPREQKAIGRTVKNFDPEIWDQYAYNYVADINYEKFNQNGAWRELLLMTDGFEIVEASHEDKIWGIGLSENDPRILDRENWDGSNLLGKAIMLARERIVDELSKEEDESKEVVDDTPSIEEIPEEVLEQNIYTGEDIGEDLKIEDFKK